MPCVSALFSGVSFNFKQRIVPISQWHWLRGLLHERRESEREKEISFAFYLIGGMFAFNQNFFLNISKQTKRQQMLFIPSVVKSLTPPSLVTTIVAHQFICAVKVHSNNNNCTVPPSCNRFQYSTHIFDINKTIHTNATARSCTRSLARFPIFCPCNSSQFACRLLIFLYFRGYYCWNCSCPKQQHLLTKALSVLL